ncbi:MAG: DUF2066 domain-containing protein, partial [Alphaproteobacteria bacterium]
MKRFLITTVLFLACFCIENTASAATGGIYRIENIKVDKTSETVTKAKKEALQEGQLKAFEALLKRLLTQAEYSAFSIDEHKIPSFVSSLRIKSEKKSRVRYIAELGVRFNPLKVKKYLKAKGVKFTETIRPKSLVIPVLHSRKTYLWSPYNQWLGAWKDLKDQAVLVPIVVPTGTEADRTVLTKKDILSKNITNIKRLMLRYRTKAAFLAIAEQNTQVTDVRVILVDQSTRSFNDLKKTMMSFSVERKGSAEADLRAASAQALFQIEEMWKQASAVNFNDKQSLALSFPTKNIEDL